MTAAAAPRLRTTERRNPLALVSDAVDARRALLVLTALVAISAALRLFHFHGFNGFDDAEYARFAHQMVTGSFPPGDYTGPAVFPLRVGVIVPAAVAFRLFGMSEWSLAIYPLLASLSGIVLVYLFTAELFGRVGGLIAASLLAILPGDFDVATMLLPDLPAAVFAAAAITCILFAERRLVDHRWQLLAAGVIAGLGFGFAWLCKESVAYLAPFCVAWMIIGTRSHGWRQLYLWGGVAAGSLLVLGGEMVAYSHLHGDALFRFHEVERNYRQWESSFFIEGSEFGWKRGESRAHALVHRLFVSGPGTILLNRTLLFLPLLGLLATLYAWRRKDRSFLVPGIWLWSLVLMLNFSSSSMSAYTPLALFQRYLYPLAFAAVSLTAGFIARTVVPGGAYRPLARARRLDVAFGAGAALMLVWIGGRQLVWSMRSSSAWYTDVWTVAPRVAPSTSIYSDALSLRGFEFKYGFPRVTAWKDLGRARSAEEIPTGSLVLINPTAIRWLNKNAGMWVAWPQPGLSRDAGYPLRLAYESPPPTWTRLWTSGDVSLYRVERTTVLSSTPARSKS